MPNYQNEGSSYKLLSALLTSERISPYQYEIANCVSDINIYEDINRPFLTGKIAFSDFNDVINKISFSGDEKIKLTLRKSDTNAEDIVRTFNLDYIIESKEVNNNSAEVYVFHMVEDVEYESNIKNVNKYYEGKPSEIIQNIINDYIPNRVFVNVSPNHESDNILKVIIPNLNPLEAINWVCKKANSDDGLPFFCFTTLLGGGTNNNYFIYYINLKWLLLQGVLNKEPYTYTQSSLTKNSNEYGNPGERQIINQRYQILDYKDTSSDDLRTLISEGMIGSTHRFVDIINGEENKVRQNIGYSLVRLQQLGLLSDDYLGYTYNIASRQDNILLAEKESAKIYNYPSLKPYEIGFSNQTSMVEERDGGSYGLKVNSTAILYLLYKRKMTITLEGANFIGTNVNRTVGNLINIAFIKPDHSDNSKSDYDKRKSGRQIITKAVHMFKQNDYHIGLDICKLESIKKSPSSPAQDVIDALQFFEGITTV